MCSRFQEIGFVRQVIGRVFYQRMCRIWLLAIEIYVALIVIIIFLIQLVGGVVRSQPQKRITIAFVFFVVVAT